MASPTAPESSRTDELCGNDTIISIQPQEPTVGKNSLEVVKVASCSIDVKSGYDSGGGGERICRICHLSSSDTSEGVVVTETVKEKKVKVELIKLGCMCKGELGAAHKDCAETWFKMKGNRYCEICGEAVTNITGTGDDNFMEEWNESRIDIVSTEPRGFWRGQPFCNFLMALLIILVLYKLIQSHYKD